MVNRSIHIPTELDERVLEHTTAEDSYSSVVQEALELWLEAADGDLDADKGVSD